MDYFYTIGAVQEEIINSERFNSASEILYKYSAHIPPEILVLLNRLQYSTFEMSLVNTVNWSDASISNPDVGLSTYLKDLQDIIDKLAMRALN